MFVVITVKRCETVTVWLGLGAKTTWLGLGKDDGSASLSLFWHVGCPSLGDCHLFGEEQQLCVYDVIGCYQAM